MVMKKNGQLVCTHNFFEIAERKFYELTDTLHAHHTLAMKFSDIEKLIENEGRELLRLLLRQ